MSMNRMARRSACMVALAIAGCASSPATRIVLPPPDAPAAQADAAPRVPLRLRTVRLPGYLEDYPVVTGRSGNALVVADRAEWGERLPEGVTRVLREALAQRRGASGVLLAGDRDSGAADLRVEFLALDPAGGTLQLDARWAFSCPARVAGHAGRTSLQEPVDGTGPAAVAGATTRALARTRGHAGARSALRGVRDGPPLTGR
jgi:uncharacterized lipoprotein YmbA